MDSKYWLRTLIALGIMLPGAAEALGLGSLVILSAPGEPFHAEIPIHTRHPRDLSGAQVGLASRAAYSMVHLPVASGLEHWRFEIRPGPSPAIVISSPVPLSSTSLLFLVQMDWSGGQMVREYVASEGSGMYGAPASGPVPTRMVTLHHRQPSVAAMPVPSAVAPGPMVNGWASVSRYGPVPENSSLYQIVRDINRSRQVAMDQAMAALVRANPQAFRNGNPDFLLAGSMLAVPRLAQVKTFTPAEARAWLRTQAGRAARPVTPVSGAKPATVVPSAASAHAGASSTISGQKTTLVLSSAPSKLQAQGGEQQRLLAENARLKGMVQSMEQRLNQTEKTLSGQSAELSRLSRQAGNSGMNSLLWLSLGGNLLLLMLFVWMYRRQEQALRRQRDIANRVAVLASPPKETVSSPRAATPMPESPAWAAPQAQVAVAAAAAAATPVSGDQPESRSGEGVSSWADERNSSLAGVQDTEEPAAENRFEVDPIEQADLYLTYGKSEQAATVLQEGLEANPRRKDLYVQLLSLYEKLGRRDEYLDLAERMRGRFGPNNVAWQEVEAQGARLFPGNPLFVTPADPGDTSPSMPGRPSGLAQDGQDMARGPSLEPLEFLAPPHERLDFPLVETPEEAPEDGRPEKLDFQLDKFFSADSAEDARGELEFALAPSEEHKRELFATLNEEFRALEEKPESAPDSGAGLDLLLPGDVLEGHAANAEGESGTSSAGDWDAVGTKLDLGKAYLEMGDRESARELLEEVTHEGSPDQRDEAYLLLSSH